MATCLASRPMNDIVSVNAVSQPVVPAVASAPTTATTTIPAYCQKFSDTPARLATKIAAIAGNTAAQPSTLVALPSGVAKAAYAGWTPRFTADCRISGSVAAEDCEANANWIAVPALAKNFSGLTLATNCSRIGYTTNSTSRQPTYTASVVENR